MRICIDIDGVLCEVRRPDQTYAEVKAIPGAVESVRHLKEKGHYIILHTARHMQTMASNLGKVNANIAAITLEWLRVNGIEYDEIYFGKPNADVYIDDRAVWFLSWSRTLKAIRML
jgi:capsule biosynthesis phosphatase